MPPPGITAAMTRELGVVDSNPAGYFADLYESTPELRFPANLAVFDRMRRTDGQVRALIRSIILPILGTAGRIQGAGVNPAVRATVEAELGLALDANGRRRARPGGVRWDEFLRHSVLHLPFGFMPFEQWYDVTPPDLPGLPGNPPEIGHVSLAERMPRSVVGIDVDMRGQLVGMRQTLAWGGGGFRPIAGAPTPLGWAGAMNAAGELPIARQRLVWFVNEREGSDWAGQSILRSSYKHWLIKDALLRLGVTAVDRQGMGVPVVTYPADEGRERTNRKRALQIASEVRAGEETGVALEEGWSLSIEGVTGSVQSALEWVTYHDQAMSRSNLAMFLDLGHDGGLGHGSLGDTFLDYFLMAERALLAYLEEIITEEIIRPFVRVNFGEDEPYPTLAFDDIEAESRPTSQALQQLAEAGLLMPDEPARAEVRRRFGIPPEPPAAPGAGTPPSGPESMVNMRVSTAVGNLVRAGMPLADALRYLGLDPNRLRPETLRQLDPNTPDLSPSPPGVGGVAGPDPTANLRPSPASMNRTIAAADPLTVPDADGMEVAVDDVVGVTTNGGRRAAARVVRLAAADGQLPAMVEVELAGTRSWHPAAEVAVSPQLSANAEAQLAADVGPIEAHPFTPGRWLHAGAERCALCGRTAQPDAVCRPTLTLADPAGDTVSAERARIRASRRTVAAHRPHRTRPAAAARDTATGLLLCLVCGQPAAAAGQCPGLTASTRSGASTSADGDNPTAMADPPAHTPGDLTPEAPLFRVPDEARHVAARGLDLHRQGSPGGTPASLARGRQLAAGGTLSLTEVLAIAGWFARNDRPGRDERDRGGRLTPYGLMRLLWGGDAAKRWATKLAVRSTRSPMTETTRTAAAAVLLSSATDADGDGDRPVDWTGLTGAPPPESADLSAAAATVAPTTPPAPEVAQLAERARQVVERIAALAGAG